MAFEIPNSFSHNLSGDFIFGDHYVRPYEIDSFMFLSVQCVSNQHGRIIGHLWWYHDIETVTLYLGLSNE